MDYSKMSRRSLREAVKAHQPNSLDYINANLELDRRIRNDEVWSGIAAGVFTCVAILLALVKC